MHFRFYINHITDVSKVHKKGKTLPLADEHDDGRLVVKQNRFLCIVYLSTPQQCMFFISMCECVCGLMVRRCQTFIIKFV